MTKRRDVVRLLRKNGFSSIGGKNHEIFVKPGFRTEVPRHNEIGETLFREIKKQAGLK